MNFFIFDFRVYLDRAASLSLLLSISFFVFLSISLLFDEQIEII